ncbi:hypothetical protein ACFL27_23885 [candidate division CSSED10-310 bacterium]|uniref:Uncharacterized protein n=1 Tax=candidate division CSSED10-310 bacterium TaxID=2855610 RepID=A0ABV6Z488_UNCC1
MVEADHSEERKQEYVKPRLRVISLAINEVLAGECKTITGLPLPPQLPISCQLQCLSNLGS